MITFPSKLAAASVATLALAACGGALSPDATGDEPYVRGAVASISHSATGSGILVQPATGCGIMARVDQRTRFARLSATSTARSAAIGDLAVGDTVEVFVSGAVAESCPAQGYAARMVIVAAARR